MPQTFIKTKLQDQEMKPILYTFIAHFFLTIPTEAGSPEPLPDTDTDQTLKKSERVFEADFVSIKTSYLHRDKPMSAAMLDEYRKVNGAVGTQKVALRYWDKEGNLMPPPPPKTPNKSNDPFEDVPPTKEEIAWQSRYSHYTVSLIPDGTQFRPEEIRIQDLVELKATKILKGAGKPGDTIRLKLYRSQGSACPHILSLGPLKKKKRYFLIKNDRKLRNPYDFRYQLLEE